MSDCLTKSNAWLDGRVLKYIKPKVTPCELYTYWGQGGAASLLKTPPFPHVFTFCFLFVPPATPGQLTVKLSTKSYHALHFLRFVFKVRKYGCKLIFFGVPIWWGDLSHSCKKTCWPLQLSAPAPHISSGHPISSSCQFCHRPPLSQWQQLTAFSPSRATFQPSFSGQRSKQPLPLTKPLFIPQTFITYIH